MYMDETEIMLIMVFVVLGLYLIIMGVGIASYIMNSLSLYTIANRRQIKNPWLAWIPIAALWIQGSIADDYDEQNGIKRKWRVVLLTLSVISTIGVIIVYVAMVLWMLVMAAEYSYSYIEPDVPEIVGFIVMLYGALILVILVASALQICKAITLYKIYESTVPEKSLKYMLVGLLVPLAESICLMKCRKQGYSKELVYPGGMPEMMQEINVPTYMPEPEPILEDEKGYVIENEDEIVKEDEPQS